MAQYKQALVKDAKNPPGIIVFPAFITQKEMDALKDFRVCDQDTFVVAYPKSGTTWMEQIVHLLANNGEQGDKVLSEAIPWLEGAATRYGGLDNLIVNSGDRRYFHSHLPLSLMPMFGKTKAKYIYVARNPKDNAVSYYYHACSKMGYEGSWKEFFQLYYVEGKVAYGLIFEHVWEWWKVSQNSDNVMFVKYEDMKKDLAQVVTDVASFIDIPLTSDLLDAVVAASKFSAMAINPKANLDWVPQREGIPKHMRKGIVGDWKNHFSSEDNMILDALYQSRMVQYGLEFEFE